MNCLGVFPTGGAEGSEPEPDTNTDQNIIDQILGKIEVLNFAQGIQLRAGKTWTASGI